MTPKEKAQELFDKMHEEIYNRDMYNDLYRAKQCALIAVNQLIEYQDFLYNIVPGLPYKYWDKVKKEIEAL